MNVNLEEEIISLQKDLVIYLLFEETSVGGSIDWYAAEFENILRKHGPISDTGLQHIKGFFRNVTLLLKNPIIYDHERAIQELVTLLSAPAFTQSLMSAGQKFSDADRDRAKEILNGFMYNCIEKSKNPEDLQKALAAKSRGD